MQPRTQPEHYYFAAPTRNLSANTGNYALTGITKPQQDHQQQQLVPPFGYQSQQQPINQHVGYPVPQRKSSQGNLMQQQSAASPVYPLHQQQQYMATQQGYQLQQQKIEHPPSSLIQPYQRAPSSGYQLLHQQQTMTPPVSSYQQQMTPPASNYQQQTILPPSNYQQQMALPSSNYQQQTTFPSSNYQQQMTLPANNYQQQMVLPPSNNQQQMALPASSYQQQKTLPLINHQQQMAFPSSSHHQQIAASQNEHVQHQAPFEPQQKAPPPQDAFGTGRIQMACPTNARASVARNTHRKGNKHRRLFDGQAGALKDGEPVSYIIHGEKLLTGVVVIRDKAHSGILCHHCNAVVSCSAFENHAGHGQRRNPYDGITTADGLTLRQVAAQLPSLSEEYVVPTHLIKRSGGSSSKKMSGATEALSDIAERCRNVLGHLDTLASSCVVCYQTDFEKDNFSDRTVIICDQCEREYHVGCLRGAGRCDLKAVPEGDWLCCSICSNIRQHMAVMVASGESSLPSPVSGPYSKGVDTDLSEYTWHVLRGKSESEPLVSGKALKLVQEVLQESFDPIIDVTTHQDLLPKMVYAQSVGESFDFQGMYSILLKHRGKAVCSGLLRIFGEHMAELPLVATKADARRQGHCRVLINAIEMKLQELGVKVLSLPAAASAVYTWTHAFSFRPIELPELQALQSEFRLLMFPGSQLLYKTIGPQPPEGPFAFALQLGMVGVHSGIEQEGDLNVKSEDEPDLVMVAGLASSSGPLAPASKADTNTQDECFLDMLFSEQPSRDQTALHSFTDPSRNSDGIDQSMEMGPAPEWLGTELYPGISAQGQPQPLGASEGNDGPWLVVPG